ncbi:MAG: sigma-70 family RNA polymerase sigma factor [Deltaproteobacteria bacterium]|nr:sigma-70 family RNA polymerase sigma factor [Deltaproteobacteria bacterium]
MDPFKAVGFLDAYRRGESEALASVYRYFSLPLRRFLIRGFLFRSEGRSLHFRGVMTAPDLDDVVQETFRRAFGTKARQAFDGQRPFRNYLFTIARNIVVTQAELCRRQVLIGDAVSLESGTYRSSAASVSASATRAALGVDLDAAQALEQREFLNLLRSFLRTLSSSEQDFFMTRFLDALSQEATARHLGCNRARVRKVETRLRTSFLRHMNGTGYFESQQPC